MQCDTTSTLHANSVPTHWTSEACHWYFPTDSDPHQQTGAHQIVNDSTNESTMLHHSHYTRVGYSIPIPPLNQSTSKSLLISLMNQQRVINPTIGIIYLLPIPPLDQSTPLEQSLYIMMHDTCNYTPNVAINTTYITILNYNSPLYNLYIHDNHTIHP